jgi:hypothetical protein
MTVENKDTWTHLRLRRSRGLGGTSVYFAWSVPFAKRSIGTSRLLKLAPRLNCTQLSQLNTQGPHCPTAGIPNSLQRPFSFKRWYSTLPQEAGSLSIFARVTSSSLPCRTFHFHARSVIHHAAQEEEQQEGGR